MEEKKFRIRHARTKMYVARQEKPKNHSHRMPCSNWRWVWKAEQATEFREIMLIHPIIQMGIQDNDVVVEDVA